MSETWADGLIRAELVAAGASLARRGLVRGWEGNLSARLDDEWLLMTRRGASLARLTGLDLVRCALTGVAPEMASSEIELHRAAYRRSSVARVVVHAHPAAVLGLSLTGRLPDPRLLAEARALLPAVALVPALAPGSVELAEACAEALAAAPLAVLAEHGVVAVGGSFGEAVLRIEIAELLAGMALLEGR